MRNSLYQALYFNPHCHKQITNFAWNYVKIHSDTYFTENESLLILEFKAYKNVSYCLTIDYWNTADAHYPHDFTLKSPNKQQSPRGNSREDSFFLFNYVLSALLIFQVRPSEQYMHPARLWTYCSTEHSSPILLPEDSCTCRDSFVRHGASLNQRH